MEVEVERRLIVFRLLFLIARDVQIAIDSQPQLLRGLVVLLHPDCECLSRINIFGRQNMKANRDWRHRVRISAQRERSQDVASLDAISAPDNENTESRPH